MKRKTPLTRMTSADYVVPNGKGEDRQIAESRFELIRALQRVEPRFLLSLRDDIYPKFVEYASSANYSKRNPEAEAWYVQNTDHPLKKDLTIWLQRYNLHLETWVLEGALNTLRKWHSDAKYRETLADFGFKRYVVETRQIFESEHGFKFVDFGWDPTFLNWQAWRYNVRKRFEEALREHKKKLDALAKERNLIKVKDRFTPLHFEWLARYHCMGITLQAIADRAHAADATTVLKGIRHASGLAKIQRRGRRRTS
jgi:hypothetical protein